MLLRGSGEHHAEAFDLAGILPGSERPSGVAGEPVLNELADAFYAGDPGRLARARAALERELGPGALVDAAGIVGIFDAVVRVADATGIPLEDHKAEASAGFRAALGIDAFRDSE